MRRARLFSLLLVAGTLACTVTAERVGPRLPVDGANLALGMRAEIVVEGLGVPDEIESATDGFRFVYRFVRRDEERLQIGSYGFKLATNERADLQAGSLELLFDSGGRLVGSQMRESAAREADWSASGKSAK